MAKTEMTWVNRKQCETTEDAMAALADGIVQYCEEICEGGPESAFNVQGMLEEFAYLHDIPFNQSAAMEQAVVALNKKYQRDYGYEYSRDTWGTGGWDASFC